MAAKFALTTPPDAENISVVSNSFGSANSASAPIRRVNSAWPLQTPDLPGVLGPKVRTLRPRYPGFVTIVSTQDCLTQQQEGR